MSDQNYFKVPTSLRMRTRRFLAKGPLTPFVLSTIRADLELQLQSANLASEEKELTQRMFELVLGVDLRLRRMEEQLDTLINQDTGNFEKFKSVSMELGAQGFLVKKSDWPFPKTDSLEAFEFLLPLVPEWSFLARIQEEPQGPADSYHFRFHEIHADDQEMIHRYVRSRERELLRARKGSV